MPPNQREAKIPNTINRAFMYCRGLTSVTIGSGVTSIGEGAFRECVGLKEVHISDLAAWCGIEFGDENAQPLSYARHLFMDGKEIIKLEIPDSVTAIGAGAFYGCSGLTSVTIGDAVTSIGAGAFSGCKGLTGKLKIPDSVTAIGGAAFYECEGLTSVTIPDSVTIIEMNTFCDCNGLTSVILGNSVTTIGFSAFLHCDRLTSIIIPKSVTVIEEEAFGVGLKAVYFENPNGWKANDTPLSGLDDPAKAAQYLTDTYGLDYWKREG